FSGDWKAGLPERAARRGGGRLAFERPDLEPGDGAHWDVISVPPGKRGLARKLAVQGFGGGPLREGAELDAPAPAGHARRLDYGLRRRRFRGLSGDAG